MHLRDAPGAEYYVKQVREHGPGVGFVSVTERKHVMDWLEPWRCGQRDSARLVCAYYSVFVLLKAAMSTTPPTPPRSSCVESVYHTSDTACGGTDDDAFEAALCTDVHDVEVVRRIKQNEPVELRGRNTVLRGTKPTVGNPPTNYLKIHN